MALRIESIVYEGLVEDPASPEEGETWYNSTDKRVKQRINGVNKVRAVVGTPDTTKSIDIDVVQGSNRWLTSSSAAYELAADYIFAGTEVLGTPVAIKTLAWTDSPAVGSLRMQDITHGLTICEAQFSNNTKAIVSLGALSNLPAGESIFELQIKKVSGASQKNVYVSALHLRF